MGKNNKPAAIPEAAPKATKEAKTSKEVKVSKMEKNVPNFDNYSGMSIDSTVTALERLGKMVYDNPRAKEQFDLTDDQVKTYNEFVLSGMTTALVIDIAAKKSRWSATMNQTQLEIVKRVANDIGVTFDAKFLPAPNEDGTLQVDFNPETIKITKEIEDAAKEEVKAAETNVELDPTKFTSDEDLAIALNHIIVSEKAAFLKFTRTSALLKSYLLIKAGDNEEEKKKINEKSVGELLDQVFKTIKNSKSVNKMPFVLNGFGKYIYRETAQAMSPVLAFVKLRDAAKTSAGVPCVNSDTLVGILRTLVEYCANNAIKEEEAKIESNKKNLEAVSKDKKKNAEAIADIENKIAINKANIEHFKDVIDVTHNPSSDFADNFLEDYDNPDSETYRRARQTFKYITQSYYGEDFTKTANTDHMKKNVQQYIGIITNMFRPAANQFEQFSESKLIDFSQPATKNEKN